MQSNPQSAKPNDLHSYLSHVLSLNTLKQLAVFLLFVLVLFYPGQPSIQSYSHPSPTPAPVIGKPLKLEISEYPVSDGEPPPIITAQAAIVQDLDSKVIIYEKNPDTMLMPASTTKIMTALVALDYYQDLTQVITITNEHYSIGHSMKLVSGEQITVLNLLYGLLIESGNDAAFALANNYCSSEGNCGYDQFINRMNSLAQELNLHHTTFLNPSGVEQVGHLTTVRDLAILASYASSHELISEITQTQSIIVTDVTGNISHYLTNTNKLLKDTEGVVGMKTGWTENAGECLVTLTKRNEHSIITVVLGSNDRFSESKSLINWTFDHHTWLKPDL